MKVETLGSFNFDVILCVGCVCVCDMTQLLQRSMCVCNTKFQPLTHLARVINMLCVHQTHAMIGSISISVDRIPVDSEKFRRCWIDWKNINQSTPDVPISLNEKSRTFWIKISSVAQFNQRNFLFKENKENLKILPDVVQSLFFVSRHQTTGRSLVISEFKFTRRFYLHDCLNNLRDCW